MLARNLRQACGLENRCLQRGVRHRWCAVSDRQTPAAAGHLLANMDTEVRTLKQELARTQDALRAATRRCRDLVRELDNRTAGHESERALRDQQLSKILRALLVLEARLKQEQKSIRQLLCEKDQVIRNQQLEIAKLRRYTKNYIKCNRESRFGKNEESGNNSSSESNSNRFQIQMDTEQDGRENSALSKDIQDLKCEIITKLTPADASPSSSPLPLPLLDSADHRIKKTHSFAGSDISKTSLTSSENTDVSIITTTTEGSPSLLSTEGFCEGESTDVSPSSTLNKSISRCTPTIMTDSENEITMILNDSQDEGNDEALENNQFRSKAVLRRLKKNSSSIEIPIITRSDSNDDGMDCNFASDDDDDVDNDGDDDHSKDAAEPVFKSSSIERFPTTNPQDADVSNVDKSKDFSGNNNNNNNNNNVNNNDSNSSNSAVNNNNNNDINKRIEIDEQITDDTSGNWYSDPDEDRTNDDTLSHDTYHPNSNHNSVLECVNQILLRDIEEEENVLSITRRYKHRGKVVRFQAKLSDIESVGSEVERRNSEEIHKELSNANLNVIPCNNFETTSSEDEFGMRIVQSPTTNSSESHFQSGSFDEENADKSKAIPIVIIEPREEEIEEARNPIFASMILAQKKMPPVSPPLKLERIEEKACLQMSTKGLTIAKNLDYEDIESLPRSNVAPCKTPPALPPKPQFRNNTLILKKIPSPSFLIVESRKKQQQLLEDNTVERGKRFLSLISSPARTSDAQKSLNFDEAAKSDGNGEEVNFWRNKFNDVRSAFQRQSDRTTDSPYEECRNSSPKVTNMIRHFEEFKIGDPDHRKEQRSDRPKESRYSAPDLDQEFDMRQNFEEFNLDECDLSGDPDRPEGDGSERLGILPLISYNENSISVRDSDVDSPSTLDYGYDHFLEATGLSNKSILTPSRLLSNHKGMLKPKDIKYKSRVRATAILEKHGISATGVINKARVKRWTGPFV